MNLLHDVLLKNNGLANYSLEDLDTIKRYETNAVCSERPQDFDHWLRAVLNIILPTADGAVHKAILSDHKRLQSWPFNDKVIQKRGLHAFRVIFSHYAHAFRKKYYVGYDPFDKVGFVTFENFLGDKTAERILGKFKDYPISVNKQIPNIIVHQDDIELQNIVAQGTLPEIMYQSIRHRSDDAIKKMRLNTFMQRVHNKPDDGDNQKNIHSDTFFPALKFWYFPQEVTEAHGPFMYSPDSCRLTKELVEWYYYESIKCCDGTYDAWKLVDHEEGSFRISENELKKLGLTLKPMTVKADTLLVGNVFGFHSRGHTTEEWIRPAIHGSIRVNDPFGVSE